MDEKRWSERLEADLTGGHWSLSKARIHQLSSEYRRTLALGLRLAASDLSAESRSKEETLEALLERFDRPRHGVRARVPALMGRAAAALGIVIFASIALLVLPSIISALSAREPPAAETEVWATTTGDYSLSNGALSALNLALEKESLLTPPTYDPDERVPTRILELVQAPLGEVATAEYIDQNELDPSTLVWVARLTGEWMVDPPDPMLDGFEEFQRENRYLYIEVLIDARTGQQVGGIVGFEVPDGVSP